MWILARAVDNRLPLMRDGAHTAVMAAARAHGGDVEVARGACGALLNMSCAADCRASLSRDGAREFLASMLRLHPGDATVQDCCRRAVL